MNTDYEFIVVGSGSAGSVLAGRLSEDPNTRVLLLEAGPPNHSIWLHLPIGYSKTMWSDKYNWHFVSLKTTYAMLRTETSNHKRPVK